MVYSRAKRGDTPPPGGILEFLPYEIKSYNNEELLKLEYAYINLLNPSYNILKDTDRFKKVSVKLTSIKDVYDISDKVKFIDTTLTEERKVELKNTKDKITQEFNKELNDKLSFLAKNRTKDYWSPEGLKNISVGKSKIIYLSAFEDISKPYLCKFESKKLATKYLNCSEKTLWRSFKIGYIYVPNVFIPLLNQNHIDNHESIIDFIDKSNLDIYKYRKESTIKFFKLKAGLSNYRHFTKVYISYILARTLQ